MTGNGPEEKVTNRFATFLLEKIVSLPKFIYLFIYLFLPSTRVHVVPFTGGLLLLLKATGAAREPTPRPFTTVGEPIPRTGRHWELNPVPLDLQTNALPTELTGRLKCLAAARKPDDLSRSSFKVKSEVK